MKEIKYKQDMTIGIAYIFNYPVPRMERKLYQYNFQSIQLKLTLKTHTFHLVKTEKQNRSQLRL